ncbi:MAG: hypothetical protein RLZZ221_847 [Verrucomicrobiota bacterium]
MEGRDLLARDTRGASAIRRAAQAGDDIDDDLLGILVLRSLRHDDPVAVVGRGGQQLGGVGGLGDRDGAGRGASETRDDLTGAIRGGTALRRVGIDGINRQTVGPGKQRAGVLQSHGGPLDGGDDLGDAHAAVAIGVDEREGLLVEFESLHRAGERHPKLLVEVLEAEEVGAGIEGDLVEAAGAEKGPTMRGRGCCHAQECRPRVGHPQSRAWSQKRTITPGGTV